MKKGAILFSAVALAVVAAPAAAQNIVTNGGFETGDFTGWTSSGWGITTSPTISGNYSAFTGCVGPGCIRNTDGSWSTTTGAYLYQDLATTPGASRTLSFAFNPEAGTPNELVALFGGTTAEDLINVANGTVTYTMNDLVASGSTTRLMFLGRQDPSYNRLDDVSVVLQTVGSVPEPATWAMMLLGFGAIGMAMRRKNRQLAALAS